MKKEIIYLGENDEKEVSLNNRECLILKRDFKSRIEISEIRESRYRLRSNHYVGNVVLPEHIILIRPKIPRLNFFLMLIYANDLMELYDNLSMYPEEDIEIFEILVTVFLNRVERLVKRGLSKGYDERDADLRSLQGRILVTDDLRTNPVLHHEIRCRYSEFGADTRENQFLKFVLYRLSQMQIEDSHLNRVARGMFRYFEPVSLQFVNPLSSQRIIYSRLNQHYTPVISLAKLILEDSGLNFQQTGGVESSSFLIDMNLLFEKFVLNYLRNCLSDYLVKGAMRRGGPYSLDVTGQWTRNPDIVIKSTNRSPLLVMDAKYRVSTKEQGEEFSRDTDQLFGYTFAVGVPMGLLVYPKSESSSIKDTEPRRTRGSVKELGIRTIDLTKETKDEFFIDCERFVDYIRGLLARIQPNMVIAK
jgi:5-methylcytosine-specific restriction enzyme subunit McrC